MNTSFHEPRARWSIPMLLLGSLAVIAFFVLQHPPGRQVSTAEAESIVDVSASMLTEPSRVAEIAGALSSDADSAGAEVLEEEIEAPLVHPEYRAASILLLHLGPNDKYLTIAQVSRGSRVEVLGRDEKGEWVAVNLGANLYGWVRATAIGDLDVTLLPVMPVRLLP